MNESGHLDTRIAVWKLKSTVPATKLPEETDFELLRECWADVRSVTYRDYVRHNMDVEEGTFTIKTRFFHGLSMLTCRVVFGGSWYLIRTIEPDKRADEILFTVSRDPRMNRNEDIVT